MAHNPTYFLAPNFFFKPGTGPIALGNIIADPLRPHRALTTIDATTLEKTYPRIETITNYEYSSTRSKSHDMSMSIWAQFLDTVTAKVSGERGNSMQTTYNMDALETRYFVDDPTLEEVEARLAVPRVRAVMKASSIPGFRQPVYMITGLMIAKGFSASQEKGKHRSGEVDVGGSAPTPTGQAGVGANVTRSSSAEESDGWKAGEDIVFAYQLLKIEVKGWKGKRIEYDELSHEAAYLGKDDDDEEEEDEDESLGEVTVNIADAHNLPTSRSTGGFTTVELEEGDRTFTCISAVDI
ncbi:hypothetical protein ASPWEDRAFT_437545 [Aspergillus wentii DTO 134E9]|uniref:Uncharacterized protein n=1 Tax=Aspergillus wentii DTO 134E9 TaxID=1073089 RepID=A0A1L9RQ07_ASPWE|nr:uncharacterized protein ASPWEDRAFT_437545 [Aspergillus wentii DTO 134E9]KAI9928488.1 hypothetical protein MW887_002533 [Aspergillus wentii]OJJ37021.1 hypothetical protein ASPWEDRAFT_437545 [Aspergillus wentii DTO 134E9]